ncbi:MAG: phosphoribosylformylglycinamidine synthase I [Elusimicrobiota bacterium]|jgi:phosphoribosylformylglycinamidine synthase|nr:phosphoribosylformylglycinamidine synthase I [Elusimicrobiota bacterium]
MKKIKVLVLRTAGTNCDYETQVAFELCKAKADRVHVNELIEDKNKIFEYNILALPGGFSYGDDIASGKILANEIKYQLKDTLQKFAINGNPIIGICNGFQVLVKMGLLPDPHTFEQTTTLSHNDSNKFECRWIYLQTQKDSNCLWTKNLPDVINLPIAHGEGKFIPKDKNVLDELNKQSQVVFRYCDRNGNTPQYPLDPNGSIEQIAGICNKKGNIFGLMPHPERYIFSLQHPLKESAKEQFGWGKFIFQNAVDSCL